MPRTHRFTSLETTRAVAQRPSKNKRIQAHLITRKRYRCLMGLLVVFVIATLSLASVVIVQNPLTGDDDDADALSAEPELDIISNNDTFSLDYITFESTGTYTYIAHTHTHTYAHTHAWI